MDNPLANLVDWEEVQSSSQVVRWTARNNRLAIIVNFAGKPVGLYCPGAAIMSAGAVVRSSVRTSVRFNRKKRRLLFAEASNLQPPIETFLAKGHQGLDSLCDKYGVSRVDLQRIVEEERANAYYDSMQFARDCFLLPMDAVGDFAVIEPPRQATKSALGLSCWLRRKFAQVLPYPIRSFGGGPCKHLRFEHILVARTLRLEAKRFGFHIPGPPPSMGHGTNARTRGKTRGKPDKSS